MRKKQLRRRLDRIQDEVDATRSLAFPLMDKVQPTWGWEARFILEHASTNADEEALRVFEKWLYRQDRATITGEAMIAAFDQRVRKSLQGKLDAYFEAQIKDGRQRKRLLRLVRSAREKAT